MKPLQLTPEARDDIVAAARWYEDREPGLGVQFVTAVDTALARVEAGQMKYPIAHGAMRRALTRRFPYAIYFLVEPDSIVVLALLHQRRDRSVLDERGGS